MLFSPRQVFWTSWVFITNGYVLLKKFKLYFNKSRNFCVLLVLSILWIFYIDFKNHDSSVGIVLGYRLDDRGSRVRFPAGARSFSLHHHVQNSSGAHSVSCLMGTKVSFPGGKAAGREADHSPPSSAKVNEWVELYLNSPNKPSWCGTPLKHRDNFTCTFYLYIDFILYECCILYLQS
jgi:hypothetical protein